MPDQGAHLSLVKKNLNFLRQCELEPVKISVDHPEWAITIKFYASLHMLEALLAPHNIHFFSHDKRNAKIFELTTILDRQFCNRYNDLYTLSKTARYMGMTGGRINWKDCENADEAFQFILASSTIKLPNFS